MKKRIIMLGITIFVIALIMGVILKRNTVYFSKESNIKEDKGNSTVLETPGNGGVVNENQDSNNQPTKESRALIIKAASNIDELIESVDNPEDCGVCRENENCKKVLSCLESYAESCASAKGRVIYPIVNSDKKKAITYVIIGEREEMCNSKGIVTTPNASSDQSFPHNFDCLLTKESTNKMFLESDAANFIRDNCAGPYVTFLREIQAKSALVQPEQNQ